MAMQYQIPYKAFRVIMVTVVKLLLHIIALLHDINILELLAFLVYVA